MTDSTNFDADPEKSKALADALYEVIRDAAVDGDVPGDPVFNFPTIFDALVDIVALIVVGGTEGKPADNIDAVAETIGRAIAKRAHWLRRHYTGEEVVQ